MKWNETPAGDIKAAEQRLWVALGDNADKVATQINSNAKFLENLARFAINGGYEPTTSQKRARKIMGRNFFGIEEAVKHLGASPTRQQLLYLSEVPFSAETLKACKDTHVLVAVIPMSILDIRGHVKGKSIYYDQDWYEKEAFAKDKGEVGWQLVRKEPVANSTSKTYDEQRTLLSKDEENPKAQVVIYTMVGHFLNTGERLFEKVYVRCSDLDSSGGRVYVGGFDAGGFNLNHWNSSNRFDDFGLSAARKQ